MDLKSLPHIAPEKMGILLILAICFLYYFFLGWNNPSPPFSSDSFSYLTMADHIRSPVDKSREGYFTDSQFPPLYPLVLAMAGGSENLGMAHLASSLLLGLSLFIIYFWMVQQGLSPLASTLTTVAIAMSPMMNLYALMIMSENLYLLLSMLALFLLGKISRQESNREKLVLYAAAVCSLAMLSRTAGIALVFACGFMLVLNKVERRYTAILIMLLPNLLWSVYKKLMFPNANYMNNLTFFIEHNSWQNYLNMFWTNCVGYWEAWVKMFTPYANLAITTLLILCLLSAIYAISLRIAAKKVDAIYVLLYLAMILVWPYPAEADRFILVIFPLILFYGIEGGLIGLNQFWPKTLPLKRTLVIPIIIVTCILPTFSIKLNKWIAPIEADFQTYRKSPFWFEIENTQEALASIEHVHRLIIAVQYLNRYIPKDACVYFVIPQFIDFHSGFPGVHFRPPTKDLGNIENFPDCDYILASKFKVIQNDLPPYYPIFDINKEKVKPLFISKTDSGQLIAVLAKVIRPTAEVQTGQNSVKSL